jgi:hypothetical protein
MRSWSSGQILIVIAVTLVALGLAFGFADLGVGARTFGSR